MFLDKWSINKLSPDRLKQICKGRLFRSASVYAVSSFFNAGISVLLVPVLTRYLTTGEYGTLSMVNASVSVLTPFIGMSVYTALERKLADPGKEGNGSYLFTCVALVVVNTFLGICAACFISSGIYSHIGISGELAVCAVLMTGFSVLITVALVVMQMQDRVFEYAVFRNLHTVVDTGLGILFVACYGLAVSGRLWSILAAQCIFSLTGMILAFKHTGVVPVIKLTYLKDIILHFGIPMIPALLKTSILTYTNRVFITSMQNVSQTGLYAVGNQFALPVLFLAQAFNLAYVPWHYRKLGCGGRKDKNRIVVFTYLYFAFFAVLSILWSAVAGTGLKYMTGGSYEDAAAYLIWLAPGYAFTAMQMMVVSYIYYTRSMKQYNLVTIPVIILNPVLNYFLIRRNGPTGAAQATFAVSLISFLLTWRLAARVYPMPWFRFRNGK